MNLAIDTELLRGTNLSLLGLIVTHWPQNIYMLTTNKDIKEAKEELLSKAFHPYRYKEIISIDKNNYVSVLEDNNIVTYFTTNSFVCLADIPAISVFKYL